jgi:hypothetical protein
MHGSQADGSGASATPNELSIGHIHAEACRARPPHCHRVQMLFRQFAEPMQRDRGLRIIHFMTAAESPDSNALEARSFH